MKYVMSVSVFLVLLGGVLIAPTAKADVFIGSLSTDDLPDGSDGGLTGTGDWAAGVTLEWIVTDEDINAPTGFKWKYSYTLTVPKKDPSHFVIEVSDGSSGDIFTSANLVQLLGGSLNKVDINTEQQGNPHLPSTVYGIKVEMANDVGKVVTVSLFSDRIPVWKDFYAKGSSHGVWNDGFGNPDTVSYADPLLPASDGSVNYHILAPDSIPEPCTMSLLAIGGAAVLVRRRKRARR